MRGERNTERLTDELTLFDPRADQCAVRFRRNATVIQQSAIHGLGAIAQQIFLLHVCGATESDTAHRL